MAPRFVRIAVFHGPLTLMALAFFPPAHDTTPVAIPIAWLLSLTASYIMINILDIQKKKSKFHIINSLYYRRREGK